MNSEHRKVNSYLTIAKRGIRILLYCSLFAVSCSLSAHAQSRDYLTDEEIELIRDGQQIDLRIDILTKAIDRRFAVLKIDVGGAKISSKESDKWGKAPEGTRIELLADIKNILQKAIDDIDNLSSRPDSMVIDPDAKDKKPKGFSDLFPKAVRKLAAAAERYKAPLNAALETTKDEREKGILMDSIEMCTDIIASVSKLK
ncbi:MAG: hypothetical protein IPL32_01240 [Chloracidobacterium sp.]|nr:hypothetical protein [Chloracidobacterium sp.]